MDALRKVVAVFRQLATALWQVIVWLVQRLWAGLKWFLPRALRVVVSALLFPFYPLAAVLANGIVIHGWQILRGNLFFTFVPEGTAKVVLRGDGFEKVLLNLRGCGLGSNGFVARMGRERWHPWGGLRFYGVWPIADILVYKFAGWTNVLQDNTLRPHEEEWMDVISLRDDVYYFAQTAAETAPPERLPLKVEVFLTLRVVNPYRSRYAVHDWLETVINRFRPVIRDRVAQATYDELLASRTSLGGELFSATQALRREFYDRYGVETVAVEIREIEPPADYRETTTAQYRAEQAALATIKAAEAAAKAVELDGEAKAKALKALAEVLKDLPEEAGQALLFQALMGGKLPPERL